MTAMLQLLQDIAQHLEVKTSVTSEQLRDLMKKTDLRRLTNRIGGTRGAGHLRHARHVRGQAGGFESGISSARLQRSQLGSAFAFRSLVFNTASLSASELARRTWREVVDDDVLGLAAQLSYYFFLALFPAILFLLAVASFFPLSNITDDVARSLGPLVSPQVLELIQDQMRRLADNENGGLLTFGVAGALWSCSAALVSIVGALNRAYDIEEGRPWWKVRLVAIGLTLGVALIVVDCVVVGARWPNARRKARPDDWVGRTVRVDVADPAVASGVRSCRDGNRAHLLLRTGCRAGLGVDHARCRRRHDSLAAGLPPVQGLRRQLHRL